MICSSRFCAMDTHLDHYNHFKATRQLIATHLEPLVLQNLLDGNVIATLMFGDEFSLKDDAKRAVADDFTIRVRDVTGVARLAIRGNDFDHLSGIVDGYVMITINNDVVRQRAETGERREANGDGLRVRRQRSQKRYDHPMRASARKEKRERAKVCARRDPEHARFIFTPLIGPCVAITKKKVMRS